MSSEKIELVSKERVFVPAALYKEIGFECALVLSSVHYQLCEHRAHDTNKHEGTHWYYTSYSKWAIWQDNIIDENKARRCFEKLCDDGWLLKHAKGFNKMGYDKTSWYTWGVKCLASRLFTDLANLPDGCGKSAEPIPSPTELPSSLKETTAVRLKTGKSDKQIEKLLVAEIASQQLDEEMLADVEFQSVFANPNSQRTNQRQAYALFTFLRNSGKNVKDILKQFNDQIAKYGSQKSFYWFLKNADYLSSQKPISCNNYSQNRGDCTSNHTTVSTNNKKAVKTFIQQKIEEYGTPEDVKEYLEHKYNYDNYYRIACPSIPEMLDKVKRKEFN